MNKFNVRTFILLILFHVLGYIYFFVMSYLDYPEASLLYFYKVPWIFEEALRQLILHFPVLTATAVLVSFAGFHMENSPPAVSISAVSKPISRTIVLLLFFTLLYAGLNIGLLPSLYAHRHNRLYSSSLAANYLRQAEQAEAAEELDTAYSLYNEYLQIDKENRGVRDKVKLLAGKISVQESVGPTPPEEREAKPRSQYRDKSILELLQDAEEALANEDPFTAHYLAGIVLDMDENREDAKRLAAKAWQAISSMEPSRQESEKYRIFQTKLAGYEALNNQRPIEAYYIFKDLKEELTYDPDIKEYYIESLQQARQISYFIDEAQLTKTRPGVPSIVFLQTEDSETDDPAQVERTLVYIQKLVFDSGDYWAHGVEAMRFSESKGIIFHLHALHAKVVDQTLLLKGIHRHNQSIRLEPQFFNRAEDLEIISVLRIKPSIVQLNRLSREQLFLNRLNLPALLSIRPEIESFGYDHAQFDIVILMRLLKPFLFLIFSLFAVGFGWHLRYRGDSFPWHLIWIVPLLPFAVNQLVQVYEYIHRLVLTQTVLSAGFTAGLIALLIFESILLFFSLLSISIHKEL